MMENMKMQRKRIQLKIMPGAKVEIINLIDVLITLIAFFMLTTVFANQQSRLSVELPQAKQAKGQAVHSKLILEIDQDENVWYHGSRLELDQLRAVLQQATADTVVVIRGDRAVTYQKMIHLMDLLEEYHLSKISFEVKKVEG